MTGIVFNIQKFSIHDGPGIRTVVFLKGCPLSCRWCSNPEGMNARPEMAYNASLCIGAAQCGQCVNVCPVKAIRPDDHGVPRTDRTRCVNCGTCAQSCPSRARTMFGVPMTVEDILAVVEKDDSFYSRSGGGITLSGGEPLLQSQFAAALFDAARRQGLSTAVETTGAVPWEALERVALVTDFIHYDLKHADSVLHKRFTGVQNERIIENFFRLCREMPEKQILVRTPVIPGFNDTEESIADIMAIIKRASSSARYELLAFHQFGESKYAHLERPFPMAGHPALPKERFRKLQAMVEAAFPALSENADQSVFRGC